MLVTTVPAPSSSGLLHVVLVYAIFETLCYIRPGFTIRTLRNLATCLELAFHLWDIILTILGELHRDLLEDHIVLRQCTCLVREEELQSAELFGNSRIPGNGTINILIRLNLELVIQFGEVQIDSHRDRNDGTKQ